MPRTFAARGGRAFRGKNGSFQAIAVVPPTYATSFSVSAAPLSSFVGTPVTVTYTPIGGVWHPSEVLTPILQGISGAYSPSTLTPNSGTSAPITTTLTTSTAGTGTVNATSALGTPSAGALGFASIAVTQGGSGFGGWPILFTGTAGTAPTGDAALTPSPAGWLLDGAGALTMGGSVSDAYGVFLVPGYLGDGNFDVTYAAGTPTRSMAIAARNNAGTVIEVVVQPDGSGFFYATTGGGSVLGTFGSGTVPSNATSFGLAPVGNTFTLRVNGANTAHVGTTSGIPGPWQMAIGTLGTNFGTKLTQVNSTQPSFGSLTIDTIGQQVSGVPFTLTGAYTIVTPTALDYSKDGGATWIAATSPTISGGTYSFSATVTSSGPVKVRDHNNTSVIATSNTFIVNIPPGSDGYANGIYYPANAYISSQANAYIPMVSGFARFASNKPQTWYITGTDVASFALVGRNYSMLIAAGSAYNNTTQSTFSITVNVTDGTVTYSQAVTVHNASTAAYFGGNVILDSAVSGGYNGFSDAQACVNESTLQGIGGSLSFADSSGKLTVGGYNGWICTTPAAEPVSAHYGQVTTAVATVGGTAYGAPFWLIQEQPAYIALQTPGTLYTYLQPGDVVGQIAAYSDAGIPSGASGYTLVSSDGTIAMGSTGQVVVAAGATLTAGSKSLTVRVTSNTGYVTTKVITYTVLTGTLLASSNMTMTVNPALENWSSGQSVGIPSISSGMPAGATWTLTNPDDCEGLFETRSFRLFAVNSSTGAVTGDAGMQLPATSPNTMPGSSRQFTRPPHQITLTATNGSIRCRQTFSVPVAWKAGPTLYVGQGMAAAHPGLGVEYLSQVAGQFQNTPNSSYAGALILVQPNANRDYYAAKNNSNSSAGETLDTNFALRFGWHGPVCIRAANTSGARPRLGGVEGSTYGGCSIDGKSYITANRGDFIIDGFEVSYVQGWATPTTDTTHGVSNLRKDADVWGDYYVLNCNIHDGNNCIESGNGPYWTVVDKCYKTNFGTQYVSSGATHGLYCGGCTYVSFTNNIVYHGTNGHGLKTRAVAGLIQGNTIFDGERGSLSNCIDMPDQGAYLINSNTLQKGPNAQNPFIIQSGEETTTQIGQMLYRNNNVTISNNTFMMLMPDGNHFGTGVCASMGGCISAIDGTGTAITMTNNSYYLTTVNQLHKANNPYSFSAPTSFTETGAVTLTTLPTISVTDPATGFTPAVRPGPLLGVFDNSQTYDNFYYVQIDPGQDLPLTVSHLAGTGNVIANCVGYGAPMWANDGNTAMVNPFATGATWSISQAPQWNGSTPWAPVGRYVINASSGQLAVGASTPAAGVTDFIKIRVVSTMAGVAGTTCDYRFSITGT